MKVSYFSFRIFFLCAVPSCLLLSKIFYFWSELFVLVHFKEIKRKQIVWVLVFYLLFLFIINIGVFIFYNSSNFSSPQSYSFLSENIFKLDFEQITSIKSYDLGYLILGNRKGLNNDHIWLLTYRSLLHDSIWTTEINYPNYQGLTIITTMEEHIIIGVPYQNINSEIGESIFTSILYYDNEGKFEEKIDFERKKTLYDPDNIIHFSGAYEGRLLASLEYVPFEAIFQRLTLRAINTMSQTIEELIVHNNFFGLIEFVDLDFIDADTLQIMIGWNKIDKMMVNIPIWGNTFITVYEIDISTSEIKINRVHEQEFFCPNDEISNFCFIIPTAINEFITISQVRDLNESFKVQSILTLNSTVGTVNVWKPSFSDYQINDFFQLTKNQIIIGGYGIEPIFQRKIASVEYISITKSGIAINDLYLNKSGFIVSEIKLLEKFPANRFAVIIYALDDNANYSYYIQFYKINTKNLIDLSSLNLIISVFGSFFILIVIILYKSITKLVKKIAK